MLDKIFGVIIKVVAFIIISVTAVYFVFVSYYKNTFMVNTWINGIYCTGKSIEDVNSELLSITEAPTLIITGKDGKSVRIDMSVADYQVDYTESIKSLISGQNTLLWPKYLLNRNDYNIEPSVFWDEEQLKDRILNQEVITDLINHDPDVQILLTENGYEFKDTMKDLFDAEKFASLVCQNLKDGILETDIVTSDCFYDLEDNKEQSDCRKLWDKINAVLSCKIVYDMGAEQIAIDSKTLSSFIKTDEQDKILLDDQGNIIIDPDKTAAFVDDLAEEYNTYGTVLEFQSTRGDIVEVPYVTYGTKLNLKAEKAYLQDAIEKQISQVHIPEYTKEGYVRGKDDIGDTYIEIDMTSQKLYCYKAGELLVETDIVTGNMRRKWSTPEGVNYVYKKQRNRILRGEGYASPVDYWMPVKGSIGIHDADWRKKFGGEIYKTNGSHGCINVPPDIMPTVYEEFEVGTPVIMFY